MAPEGQELCGRWSPSKMRGHAAQPTVAPPAQPASQHGLSVGVSPPQRPAKPSEKPRLRQIPSAEDLETDGGGVGPVGDDGLEHRESSHGQHEARGPVPLQHQQVRRRPRSWEGAVGRLWGLAQMEGRELGHQSRRQLWERGCPTRSAPRYRHAPHTHAHRTHGHTHAHTCTLR